MTQQTISIPNDKRKNILVKTESNSKMSRSLIIAETDVRRTIPDTILHETLSSKKTQKEDLCTHCGVRQKGPGFRFLCRYCFRHAGNETIYSINSGTMNRDMSSHKIPW